MWVRKVIISEEKWRVFETWWRNVQKCRDVKNGEWSIVKCKKVMWSEVMVLGKMCVLSLIYIYVAVCRFCVVHCLIICFYYFLITQLMFLIFFLCMFSCFLCLFSILCILCFCIVLCIVSPFVYICLFWIFGQVYWPLPLVGNTIAANKYHHKHQQNWDCIWASITTQSKTWSHVK